MKIENFKKLGKERMLTYDQLSSFSGENSSENPVLIKSSELLPKHLKISGSILHVHLNKCSFDSLILKRCKNIKILNCTPEILQLENCSNIEVEACKINTTLRVWKSSQVKISNCSVSHFNLIRSHENHIENCNFDEAFSDFSSGNIFKDIQIPEEYWVYLMKNKFFKKFNLPIIAIVPLIFLSSTMNLWRRDSSASLWPLSLCIIFLLVALVSTSLLYREMRKYPPNKML